MNPNQASLFDEAELPKSEEKILSQEEEITVASYNVKIKPVENHCQLNYCVCLAYMIYLKKKKSASAVAT